ncbi:hypothetical protein [Streptomyces sp. TBY4]|uniref:hypothetical protein n=1 Tax=Streptomyces sp. TBY4 TaxID=2962030 RepID=UPI0020B64988|nr:hypothetical protein [Streptomyces sp. TBY4]MCP3757383.1 hypothetical protein [Streptomyces sp. TBY4]
MVRVFLPRRIGRAAVLQYAQVLDGHTMNLHAELPDSAPLGESAELELKHGRQVFRTPVRLYEDREDRLLMDAAVLLGAGPGGLSLTSGRWKTTLLMQDGRRTRKYKLLLVEPPVPYAGPTKPMSASPVDGLRHRLGRTVAGSLTVVTSNPKPLAEVVRIDLSHSMLVLDFRTVGARLEEPWAEFTASRRRLQRPLEALPGGAWRVVVPLEEMPPARATDHWDVAVASKGSRALRIGRRLHDVRNPMRVFTINKGVVAPRGLAPMIVHPRYTAAGNLRVTCSRMPEAGRRA